MMQRPQPETLLWRAVRLKCPRCGRGEMFVSGFRGWFQMHECCSVCNFRYGREPGFFLGSIYVNYGLTALITTAVFITLRFGYDLESRVLVFPLLAFCIVFPTLFFPYARALWLALDCLFDSSVYTEDQNEPPSSNA